MIIEKIALKPKNEMLRIGFGRYDGNWFFRIDLWRIAFRVTK